MIKQRKQNFVCVVLSVLAFALIGLVLIHAPPWVYAQTNTTVSAHNQTIHRGQTFEVDVEISNNTGILTMFLTVQFDYSVFTLTNVEQSREALGNFNMTPSGNSYDEKTGGFNILWDGGNKSYDNGTIATLTFQSSINAPLGDYPIKFVIKQSDTTSAYGVEAKVDVKNAIITVETGAFIAVWANYDGTPVQNTNINVAQHPYNEEIGGYEFSDDGELISSIYPDPVTRQADSQYVYEFANWKGAIWRGQQAGTSSIIYFVADYNKTPQVYSVMFYIVEFSDAGEPTPQYWQAKDFAYDSMVDLNATPVKENYTFFGWYDDDRCTNFITGMSMPDKDVSLYGYFKYNIREDLIPTIQLKYRETITTVEEEQIALVDVNVVDNYGLNSLMLTLDDYNHDVLTFCGFERGEKFQQMSFYTTNTDNGYIDNFKFSWEHINLQEQSNIYETGCILTLKFKVNGNSPGDYEVKMTYDKNHDATYVNSSGEIWYTLINFEDSSIPIGERTEWTVTLPEKEIDIKVTTPTSVAYNIHLVIELATQDADKIINQENMASTLGANKAISELYEIYFVQNGERIVLEQEFNVQLKLTKRQKTLSHLTLYHINNTGQMELKDSVVNDDYLTFTTNHFSYWAVVNEFTSIAGAGFVDAFTGIMMIFFAISATAYILILIIRNKKNKKVFSYLNETKKEGSNEHNGIY